uniref:ribosomal protein S2 n=1 Tax=Luzula sylvatica TaxID=59018 RepID=UPI0022F2F57B|nr:ribosomal protein S2 [Luzula sylvatica]WAI96490.1 ribosomal protein S2 [Luzula sylvatica]
MTIHSLVLTQLLYTNAHPGHRVIAHHFKVYISGSRNGIAILDSDKTLICLRNALRFMEYIIRQKGSSFFFNTNNVFLCQIIQEMLARINDRQWRVGAFFTSSFSSPNQIRSRKSKINMGSKAQPDCLVILDADRKSSIIQEADRKQIPIVSLVDSTTTKAFYQRITYPIPANNSIQFLYLFCHLITKTVMLERGRRNTKRTN